MGMDRYVRRDTLKALPEEELAKVDGASDVLSQIDDQIAYIYSELDPTAWKQMQFNEILNSDEYKKAKDELTELAKATDGAGMFYFFIIHASLLISYRI